jgi:hypothetical protein
MDNLLLTLDNATRLRRAVAIAVRVVPCAFVGVSNEAGQLG